MLSDVARNFDILWPNLEINNPSFVLWVRLNYYKLFALFILVVEFTTVGLRSMKQASRQTSTNQVTLERFTGHMDPQVEKFKIAPLDSKTRLGPY